MYKGIVLFSVSALFATSAFADDHDYDYDDDYEDYAVSNVQVGPRPYYLVDKMTNGRLKRQLEQCKEHEIRPTDFSIGHRGSALQFPEHTKESYVAAARMGSGIIECDVTFTADGELVCRHAECDLHTTTNILATPLVNKCSSPPDMNSATPFANVRCCTSDITVHEYKSLCGKMDAGKADAKTVEEYLTESTPRWRTDLYSTCGTLLTHPEAVRLFKDLGVGQTPELKSGDPARIAAVFGSQAAYAQAMIDDLKDEQIPPSRAWPQSFNYDDVLYWIRNEPAYGEQAVFLDDRSVATLAANPPTLREFRDLHAQGLNIIAPPMPVLLKVNKRGRIAPSAYARRAKRAGLDIISWTTERSGRINEEGSSTTGTFYYQTTVSALNNDGDIMTTIDVLADRVGIIGLFTDWPGTVTYYANCMGL